ncbi:hypothetical protein OPV22_034332 [Ensete ventricosum]|uniref:Yippee domain-containing protein n=1 Tax=Ensete ventricosum TaxID=4639 RepID=A0AAV8P476_ENSVE|nr:hypothetical protein OPV22_034332 [Ensete ventricosum]
MLFVTRRCHGGGWGIGDVVHNGRTNTSLRVEAHVPHHHTCMGREVGFVHCISLTMTVTNLRVDRLVLEERTVDLYANDVSLSCETCLASVVDYNSFVSFGFVHIVNQQLMQLNFGLLQELGHGNLTGDSGTKIFFSGAAL